LEKRQEEKAHGVPDLMVRGGFSQEVRRELGQGINLLKRSRNIHLSLKTACAKALW
jgi:hypothetical protein